MLDKRQEYIAEALDEIRDTYIEEAACEIEADFAKVYTVAPYQADRMKKKKRIYQVAGALVACLAVVVALALTSGEWPIRGNTGAPAGSGDGAITGNKEDASMGSAAGGSAQDMTGGVDPGAGDPSAGEQSQVDSESAVGNSIPIITSDFGPENLPKAEFTGVIKTIETAYETDGTYIVVSAEVLQCMTGDLKVHEVYNIWIPADVDSDPSAKDYLEKLEYDKEYIFTPYLREDGRWIAYRPD